MLRRRELLLGLGVAGLGACAPQLVAPTERIPTFEQDNRAMVADLVDQGIFARSRPADLYMVLPDLTVANRYEVLGAMLGVRGHSDARVAKILRGNFARVLSEVSDDPFVQDSLGIS